MQQYTEQIKEKILVSSIVSTKVALKPKGGGEFLGLCPFHQEKTPSFTVSDAKGFYYCFGCGAHGDIFKFLMEMDGRSYKEVLENLAGMIGLKLPVYRSEPSNKDKGQEALLSMFAQVADFYQKQLNSAAGRYALDYLYGRGLKKETIEKYGLGLAPENSTAIVNLVRSKFSKEDIESSSLFYMKGDKAYDPLRGRIIFPIHDHKGRVVAFGGRALGDEQPKYLNSSENPLFKKSEILYGLHLAKGSICKKREALVVEGYMDVIALANAGFDIAVAPLGTALKISQLEALWRFAPRPFICMDSDRAGNQAAIRITHAALPDIGPDKTLRFIRLSGGKDPDEVLVKYGVAGFNKCIDSAIHLAQMLFETEAAGVNFNNPEGKVKLQQTLEAIAGRINNERLRNEYKKYFSNAIYEIGRKQKGLITQNPQNAKLPSYQDISYAPHEMEIFCILLARGELLRDDEVIEELIRLELGSNNLDKLRNFVLTNADALGDGARVEASGKLVEVMQNLLGSACYVSINNSEKNLVEIKKKLMRSFRLGSLSTLEKQIKEAELLVRSERSAASFERLLTLKSLENELKLELNVI